MVKNVSPQTLYEGGGAVSSYNPHLGDLDKFMEDNMKLVHFICNKFRSQLHNSAVNDYDDLVSIGMYGLMKSYERYDPSYGTAFSSFATKNMNGYIMTYLYQSSSPGPRLPRSYQSAYLKIYKANMLENEPSYIAKSLGMTLEEVNNGLEYANFYTPIHLDGSMHEDEDGNMLSLLDFLKYEVDYDHDLMLKESIEELSSRLRPVEKSVLDLRLQGKTQQQISDVVGISRSYISRILLKIYNIIAKSTGTTVPSRKESEDIVKKQAKGNLEEAKNLLSTTDMTPTEISTKTGCLYQTVLNWSKKLRPEQPGKCHTRAMTDEERQKHWPDSVIGSVTAPEPLAETGTPMEYDGVVKMDFSKSNVSLDQLRAHFDYIIYLLGKSGASIEQVSTTIHLGG